MSNSFLAVARQGKNGLGRYGLTIVLCFGLTLGVMVLAMLPIIIALAILGLDPQASLEALMVNPFGFSLFNTVISVLMVFGLWLAFRNIHRRPLLTLIRADQTIRWAQIVKGALVWSGLGLLNMGGLALLNPGRYQVTFVAQDWFQFLIPALIAIPAIALFQGLVYAYLLQGLGLLIRQPVWLAITIALTTGLLSQLGQPASVITGMIAIATAWLMVWIVLQNQGIELLLGLCMAQSALSLLVLTSPDAPAAFPALLLRVDPIPDLAAIITRLMTMALFYGICLGLPWQRR